MYGHKKIAKEKARRLLFKASLRTFFHANGLRDKCLFFQAAVGVLRAAVITVYGLPSNIRLRPSFNGLKGGVESSDKVVCVLDANGKTNGIGLNALLGKLGLA